MRNPLTPAENSLVRSTITPLEVLTALPLSIAGAQFVEDSRETLRRILDRSDHRLLVVVGPCTIHDPEAGIDYARRLRNLAEEVCSTLFIVMRVFLEKSLATVGWKGYVNDPDLNDSLDIAKGLHKARNFLLEVTRLGLPVATETVNPLLQQYYGDLITWTVIGVHSTESQNLREVVSGLPTPVGFKNGTNGKLENAINANLSSRQPHKFVTVDNHGRTCVRHTPGNCYGHLVLRGGDGGPNYDPRSVQGAEHALRLAGLAPNLIVDCSHANSFGKPELQASVLSNVMGQILAGNRSLIGVMLESNLLAGKQEISSDRNNLRYGCSITDPCMDWKTTEKVIRGAAQSLSAVLGKRLALAEKSRLPPA